MSMIYYFEKKQNNVKQISKKVDAQLNDFSMNEIILSDRYIKWLEKFSLINPNFSNNGWMYSKETLSKQDKINIDALHVFFDGIQDYANKNYIYLTPSAMGGFYPIKYNNNGYNIGMTIGQQPTFYCERRDNIDECIDFFDIIFNKTQLRSRVIKEKFDMISFIIGSLFEENVPIVEIEKRFNITINDIKTTNEKSMCKHLKK